MRCRSICRRTAITKDLEQHALLTADSQQPAVLNSEAHAGAKCKLTHVLVLVSPIPQIVSPAFWKLELRRKSFNGFTSPRCTISRGHYAKASMPRCVS
jgi:hypothetical protein